MRFSSRAGVVWSLAAFAALAAACSGDDDVGTDDGAADASPVDATTTPRDASPARPDGSDAMPVQDADIDERDAEPDATAPEEDASLPDADASEPDASVDAGEDAAEDAGEDAAVDAGPPPVPLGLLRLEGRWDRTDPAAPRTAYPGARIVIRFTGTGVTLRLLERRSFTLGAGTSEYAVTVDGVAAAKLVTDIDPELQEETRDYPLAADLEDGVHVVELVRRTEAVFGNTRLVDVNVAGGAVLPPLAGPTRRLEFVGDSNLTGYGIEAVRPCNHTAANQNWQKAFPALVAARFGAEVEAAAYSGKGVFYNSSRTDPAVMGVLYPRSVPTDPASVYDPSQFAADAVVVLLGGNDFAFRAAGDYPTTQEVQGAYSALIDQIRAAHPSSTIACMISPGINDFYPSYPDGHPQAGQSVQVRTKVKDAIVAVVNARLIANDPKIFFHDVTPAGNDELTACDFHPSPALQETLATNLGNALAAKLGW